MAKKKTTVYLDADVLMATKAAALTSKRSESAIIGMRWGRTFAAATAMRHEMSFGNSWSV